MDKGKAKKPETKKQKNAPPEPVEEKKEEKPFTFWDIKVANLKHIFREDNVVALIRSPDRKAALADFLSTYYNKQGFKDMTEPNELSLLSNFHSYNMDFAKEQLRLPDDKVALVMNILSPFVSFKHLEKENEGIWPKSDDWTEEHCKEVAERRLETLKETLLAFSANNPPAALRIFSPAEIGQVVEYASKLYFRHFMLFSYALSTRQKVQPKKIVTYIDEPIRVRPLGEMNLISQKDQTKVAKAETKPAQAPEGKKGEEKAEEKAEKKPEKKEEEEKSVDKMISVLKMSEEAKQGIYAKIKEMQTELEAKLQDRQKKLMEKLEAMKGKGKGGKKAK